LADLLGRRGVLLTGLGLFGVASLVGGLSHAEGLLIGARLAQGIGAALMSPAALSTLMTTFTNPRDRNVALGAWAAIPGFSGAFGVILSGVLTEGPGWRWIFYINVPLVVLAGLGAVALVGSERPQRTATFDLAGAALATSGMLLAIFTLVRAPDEGWGSARTIAGLAFAAAILVAFVVNEQRASHPLVPFSIFRIKGLAAANLTQVISFSGLYSTFFFLSLYMQNVLDYSPLQTGLAYLPVTGGFMLSVGIVAQLLPRIGTKPVIVGGAVIAAGGIYFLSHVPEHGTFAGNLLPGIVLLALGLGGVFGGVTTAATEGVPADKAGIASGLLNASMQFGGALGLAVLSAVATERSRGVLSTGGSIPSALTEGFQRAFVIGSGFVLVAAAIAMLGANTRAGEHAARLELIEATTEEA
jgi:EmrB/QacA subfamily drug resistance transporter